MPSLHRVHISHITSNEDFQKYGWNVYIYISTSVESSKSFQERNLGRWNFLRQIFPARSSQTAIEWRVDAPQVSSSAHWVMQTLKGAFYIYASLIYFIYWTKERTYLLSQFSWMFYNYGSQMCCQHFPSRFFPKFCLRVQFEMTENKVSWYMTWIQI